MPSIQYMNALDNIHVDKPAMNGASVGALCGIEIAVIQPIKAIRTAMDVAFISAVESKERVLPELKELIGLARE